MDTYDFLVDPRALSLAERQQLRDQLRPEHDAWLARLAALAEDTRPAPDFPAFLLATQPFRELAQRLAAAQQRADLAPVTADELDWFLRACDGEDVFATAALPRC